MNRSRAVCLLAVACWVLALLPCVVGVRALASDDSAAAPGPAASAASAVDPAWLERMPKDDREAIEQHLSFAPPPFSGDLRWLPASPGAEGLPQTWEMMHGKVVVMQSFTTGGTAGRKWPARIADALAGIDPKDLRVLALHTPDKAEQAEAFLQRQPVPAPVEVLIDPSGEFCDALGVYRQPVNVVIDRHGAVRYAGLHERGLRAAVDVLVAEKFEPSKHAARRSDSEGDAASARKAEFPDIKGGVSNATDIRGKRAPEFFVKQWVTKRPDAQGKVVVIDFWATWCGPCVKAIPHMNDLASRFADSVVCVGISDESPGEFASGLRKRQLDLDGFRYALALDENDTMSDAITVSAIPHCIVMSSDWVVRWQGDPRGLTAKTLEQIVDADKAAARASPAGEKKAKARGWTR